MKTFYDILKIKRNATNEEIIDSYNKLEKKYKSDEEKLKNIQVAKQILTNPEARENYDKKIYEMEQNELISTIKNNTQKYNIEKQKIDKINADKKKLIEEKEKKKDEIDQIRKNINKPDDNPEYIKQKLKIKEQKELEKQERIENRNNKKILKKEERKRKELYEEAYSKYLESLGFKVKRKWTFKRIKRLVISIVSIIIICMILWLIPGVRSKLIDFYENNFVVKLFIDLIISIIEIIFSGIKSLLKVGE